MCGTSQEYTIEYKSEKSAQKRIQREMRMLKAKERNTVVDFGTTPEQHYVPPPVTLSSPPPAIITNPLQPLPDPSSAVFYQGPATSRPSLSPLQRQTAFNYRRLNQLSLRQKSARRRKMWQRQVDPQTGELTWARTHVSKTKIGNAPFGYAPSDSFSHSMSFSGSFSQSLPGTPSTGGGRVSTAALLLAAAASSSSSSVSSRTPARDRRNDSFGDSVLLSTSPGYTSYFDEDGELRWEKAETGRPAPRPAGSATLKTASNPMLPVTLGLYGPNSRQNSFDVSAAHAVGGAGGAAGAGGARHVGRQNRVAGQQSSGGGGGEDMGGGCIDDTASSISGGSAIVVPPSGLPADEPPPLPADAPDFLTYTDLESVAALTFREKQLWFLTQMAKIQKPWAEGCVIIELQREKVLEQSHNALMSIDGDNLHKWLRINFLGEAGIDAGGLEREWFGLVVEGLMSRDTGLFTQVGGDATGTYNINPLSLQMKSNHVSYFRFAGRMFGKAIMEQQAIDAPLSLPIRKQILGLPITFSDLEFVDMELHKNLVWMKRNRGVEALSLDFSVTYESSGKTASFELKPNGSEEIVTDDNKAEYLELRLRHRMLDSVKPQLEGLLQGMYEVVPPELLSVFDYQELELLMCGIPEIDVDDWKRHTEYLSVYNKAGARHKVRTHVRHVLVSIQYGINFILQLLIFVCSLATINSIIPL